MKGQEQLFSSASDEWATPADLFKMLDKEIVFDLDPCAMPNNGLNLPTFFTKEDNGLLKDWDGGTAFVNPPYSDIAAWVAKCAAESAKSRTGIVMLIPARTDTRYWHSHIFPFAQSVLFIKGRLKFGGHKSAAPFPSALVGFNIDLSPFKKIGVCVEVGNE